MGRTGYADCRQVDQAARVITVDRKVIEIGGRLFEEAPKNRKRRRTIYPRRAPEGYPLADRVTARVEAVRREQEAGTNPMGLVFPSPKGKHWRANNFGRRSSCPLTGPPDGAAKTAVGPGPGIACDTSRWSSPVWSRSPGRRRVRRPGASHPNPVVTHSDMGGWGERVHSRLIGAYPHPAGKGACRAQNWVTGAAGSAHSPAEERKVVSRAGVLPGWAATSGRTVHDGTPLPC